ncbi:MAG: glycosyltransferase [Acidimicrobiales bacterium]
MTDRTARRRVDALSRMAFRGSVGFVAATYVGYPLTALALSHIAPRPHQTGDPTGVVTVIVAAHNEGAVLAQKLRSVLDGDLDGVEVEVIVVDDGSTDDTAAAASSIGSVRVLRLPRCGKAAALAAAVEVASGGVLVFTDANSLFERGTLAAVLRPFADPAVGGVVGDQRYRGDSGSAGERAHWAFDRMLKAAESAIGSTVSATGALYAIRRTHVSTIPEGVTDDFYISTGAVLGGGRLVFAPEAVVTEWAAATPRDEYARKVRVMTRGLRAVWLRRPLLSPRHGFYSASLLSRKVFRRLTAPAILVSAAASLAAPRRSVPSLAVAAGSVSFVSLAAVGWYGPERLGKNPIVSLPTFACLSVAATMHALWNTATGVRVTRWESAGAPRDALDESTP